MSDLIKLIHKFVSGEDTSINVANEIELLLDDTFPDDDRLQEIVEILARYRPEGGDYLFNTSEVVSRLRSAEAYLLEKTSLKTSQLV